MSITKFVACYAALAVLMLASTALAQREIHHVPPVVDTDGYNPDVFHPFIEPLTFSPDYQFFAPAEYGEFGNGVEANTGWFATYDRVYLWVTRPEDQSENGISQISNQPSTLADNTGGDFTWGNRFDIGYMTAEDHGWLASFWHIDGPNNFVGPIVERVDVFEPLDEINNDPFTTNSLRDGAGQGAMNQGLQNRPERDANNPITGARDYIIQNSINVADLSSFEFNKSFRIRPLHYGSVVEPFFGFRYMKFSDFHRRDTYDRWDNMTGPTSVLMPPPPNAPPLNHGNFTVEDFVTNNARFDNHMVGGQVGMRWFKQKQRWNLAGELRVFAFQNFQSLHMSSQLERTYYQTLVTDAQIDTVMYSRNDSAGHSNEFVFGTEIRAEAAYAVTRDVWLRAGMSFMEFGRGLGRGNDLARNDQDLTIVGGTFGFTVNR